jgi:hypothetical protein
LANEQNISNIAIINFGYGQTERYYPTCTKPCSLAAIIKDTLQTLNILLKVQFAVYTLKKTIKKSLV